MDDERRGRQRMFEKGTTKILIGAILAIVAGPTFFLVEDQFTKLAALTVGGGGLAFLALGFAEHRFARQK